MAAPSQTPMNIVILDGASANPGDISWAPLEALGRLTVYPYTPRAERAARAKDAEVIIANKVVLDAELISACPKLRYIGLLSTGYNLVDTEAAKAAGVVVCNAPAYSTAGVAQHTFALLLEITNHVARHSALVHQGRWQKESWCFWDAPLTELCGKTFGAIGFGSIGRAAGRIAAALGMRVLAAGSRPTDEGRAIGQYVPLEALLAESDVVSLHCPLLPETAEMINENTLAQMKDGVILLNTARGGLVDEAALAAALASGKVAAAGLDVTAHEPLPPESPLNGAPNCFITPHTAWAARETRARLVDLVAENLRAFLQGTPQNVVEATPHKPDAPVSPGIALTHNSTSIHKQKQEDTTMHTPHPMRRKDRKMDDAEARVLLQKGEYGVLATCGGAGEPLATPLSYVVLDGGIYFHCAMQGQKLDNLRQNPRVCFAVVGKTQPIYLGDFTTLYESVLAHGAARFVEDGEEKHRALLALCEKYLPGSMAHAEEGIAKSGAVTCVVCIDVDEVSGKHKTMPG